MKIGIDLRPLQNGHKYRGIGEVAKQVTGRMLQLAVHDNATFVFYEYEDGDPKELLDVPKELKYDVVKLGKMPENDEAVTWGQKFKRNLQDLYGHPIKEAAGCDVFLQFDYAAGVPKNTRTVLVKHDLIPYLFWDRYFESAWVPFKNRAVRTTLRTLFTNHKFMHVLRRSLKNAHVIVSVSQSTKRDIEKYFGVNPKKSKVAHLGVSMEPAKTNNTTKSTIMPTKPYAIFIGAGDQRRRVDDLIAAYNNLKAKGRDIQLVLAGENFQAPEKIPTPSVRNAVLGSSYKNDILTVGYINDETKQQLIKGAVAFAFPSRYEGFGIPILEAMLLECPVIVYENSATPEVGGDHVLYARDWQGMMQHIEKLLDEPKAAKEKRAKAAKKHAEQFTWDKTAAVVFDELKNVGGR